jgi:hypothetical protein
MNVDVCKKADFLYEESDFKKFYVGLEDFLTTWNLLSIKWMAEDGHNKDFYLKMDLDEGWWKRRPILYIPKTNKLLISISYIKGFEQKRS